VFEIEREVGSRQYLVGKWEKIGFVKGNGNSNSPKEYSFVDSKLTFGTYFYRLKQIDTDGKFEYSQIIEMDFDKPLNYELEQNYPNPFNPTTKIKYRIPLSPPLLKGESGEATGGFVTLKVYDILGNEIAILVNEEKPAGIYEAEFDASLFPTGVYFYKIQAGNFISTKKMLYLK